MTLLDLVICDFALKSGTSHRG